MPEKEDTEAWLCPRCNSTRWSVSNKSRATPTVNCLDCNKGRSANNRRLESPESRIKRLAYLRSWRKRNPLKQAEYHKKQTPVSRRDRGLKCLYGITQSIFNDMVERQSRKCAICDNVLSSDPRMVHIDHCHNSGVIRGILCGHCNLLIGQARESEVILENAITYLQRKTCQTDLTAALPETFVIRSTPIR